MKRKRTLLKTVFLSLMRYERWKMSPKNIDKLIYMEQMRHGVGFTWIVALLFVMVSCSPAKKVMKSDVTQKQQTNTEVVKSTEENKELTIFVNTEKKAEESAKKNTTVEENYTEASKTHTINYDPNTPVDPKTNRRQVASETYQETGKGNQKKTNESEETLYSSDEVTALFSKYFYSYNNQIDSLKSENNSLKSEVTELKKQIGWSWYIWLLIGSGLTVLIYFIIRFSWWRKLSFILNLFK